MVEKRVLRPDDFDTIELSALVFGGIGYLDVYDSTGAPVCLHGHATFAYGERGYGSPLSERIYAAGIKGFHSDAAVERINMRKGRPSHSRVHYSELCDELNIVRGD